LNRQGIAGVISLLGNYIAELDQGKQKKLRLHADQKFTPKIGVRF